MKFYTRQDMVLMLGIFAMAACCLWLPYKKTFKNFHMEFERPLGYFSLFQNPEVPEEEKARLYSVKLDVPRMMAPMVLVASITMAGVFFCRRRA